MPIRFHTLCFIKIFDYNTVRLTGLGKGPGPLFFLPERRQ